MTERVEGGPETLLSNEEIHRRHTADPDAVKRAKEALEKIRRGDPPGPGITAEELPDFLREHG